MSGAIKIVDGPGKGKLALKATLVQTCTKPGQGKVEVPEKFKQLFPPQDPGSKSVC